MRASRARSSSVICDRSMAMTVRSAMARIRSRSLGSHSYGRAKPSTIAPMTFLPDLSGTPHNEVARSFTAGCKMRGSLATSRIISGSPVEARLPQNPLSSSNCVSSGTSPSTPSEHCSLKPSLSGWRSRIAAIDALKFALVISSTFSNMVLISPEASSASRTRASSRRSMRRRRSRRWLTSARRASL